ncbi:FAD-dependent oxidoreductase [Chelatococcus asaccharovorans]|uniref:FAD-dependent oxidoreductase n=1 Tax=Chelatococcus asaccharovorans TaxID=28210 RepID=UPI0039766E1B
MVGAGVVGLATAQALIPAQREVVIAEAAHAIGIETPARNSAVIHAGIAPDNDVHRLSLHWRPNCQSHATVSENST